MSRAHTENSAHVLLTPRALLLHVSCKTAGNLPEGRLSRSSCSNQPKSRLAAPTALCWVASACCCTNKTKTQSMVLAASFVKFSIFRGNVSHPPRLPGQPRPLLLRTPTSCWVGEGGAARENQRREVGARAHGAQTYAASSLTYPRLFLVGDCFLRLGPRAPTQAAAAPVPL